MLRRIAVAMDPSQESRAALRFACENAQRHYGRVIALGLVDRRPIYPTSSVGLMDVAAPLRPAPELATDEEVEARMAALREEVRGVCEHYGVRYVFEATKRPPILALTGEAYRSDLVVMGVRTYFRHPKEPDSLDVARALMGSGICPMVLMPRGASVPQRYLVAADGSPQCMRALRIAQYQLFGETPDADVRVVNVNADENDGRAIINRALVFLDAHGCSAVPEVLGGDPRDVLTELARAEPLPLTILGTSSKGSVKRLVFGSVTERLLSNGSAALYIAG